MPPTTRCFLCLQSSPVLSAKLRDRQADHPWRATGVGPVKIPSQSTGPADDLPDDNPTQHQGPPTGIFDQALVGACLKFNG